MPEDESPIKRQRIGDDPAVPTTNSASVSDEVRRDKVGCYLTVTFEPGDIGIAYDNTGLIERVFEGGQAQENMVEVGWRISEVRGQKLKESSKSESFKDLDMALKDAKAGKVPYDVTFVKEHEEIESKLLPQIPREHCAIHTAAFWQSFVRALQEITQILERTPFGIWAQDGQWDVKNELFRCLPRVVHEVESCREEFASTADAESCCPEPLRAFMLLMAQLLQSGYAQTVRDRRSLVDFAVYKPGASLLLRPVDNRLKAIQVKLYVYLADHVAFYDDATRINLDFWCPEMFVATIREMPAVFTQIPADITVDQWEMYSSEWAAALRAIQSFAVNHPDPSFVPLEAFMPFLHAMVDKVDECDKKFGSALSAKSRGAPLEELTQLAGIVTSRVLAVFEDQSKVQICRKWAVALLNFLVRLLTLEIPTFVKNDPMRDGRGEVVTDERQQDTEWIEGLWEHCESMGGGVIDPKEALGSLFGRMVKMPLEEQRYRLECVAPLVPGFIGLYGEQLKDKHTPPELSDFKIVINSVMQDGVSLGADWLDEIGFYPCLLEFATKRVLIHNFCERTKLQGSANDPIRLVVPRDNVLDGVCTTLNLQDRNARVDVPLEIEFRSGYADDAGTELVDEGEDQGGLDDSGSDLFVSPSEDAAHLESPGGLSTNRRTHGLIVVPSPESVVSCVQEDWEEQFELFGCVLGFAILYKETIPAHFGYAFLRSVFGLKTDSQDLLPLLENVDKTLHTKLKYILDGSYRELGDSVQDALEQSNLPKNFTVSESHCPELVAIAPLKPDGENILVTEENKDEFVMLLLERVLIKGVAKQVACFRRGMLRVIPEELVQRIGELMSVKEIELMVCGVDEIDVDDWEKHTNYENGYTPQSQPVKWFWEVVRKMSQQQRAALLSFATGSSQVPSGGFRFLQPELFAIQRVAVIDRYPEAHTCANMVDLPEYKSMEELQQRLYFAVEEAGDAFGRR
eukprot:CAMPEP_0169194626 /NCGR_PEP_ID=MMETSP1016-20121227/6794_1 /TAXON_ID=342587 /ORGANISM="Karlodinium micrum, Strain CCMP2283" /LENGTH=969 /DNA_ID=CAMNT_0009271137 /DNA_START=1 /DNA_END=2911 /DNA_ORIENTATION=-